MAITVMPASVVAVAHMPVATVMAVVRGAQGVIAPWASRVMIPPTGRWIGCASVSLQQQAGPVGDEAAHYRADEGAVLEDFDQQLEGHLQAVADEVGGAGEGQVEEEQESRDTDGSAQRLVAGPVKEVVLFVVGVKPLVDPGPGVDDGEDDPGQQRCPGRTGWRSRGRSCGTPSAARAAGRRRASPRTSRAGCRRSTGRPRRGRKPRSG